MAILNWGQPLDGIIQIAFIVEDIEASMPIYRERLGIGPWFHFKNFGFKWLKYRGEEATIDIDLCLGCSSGMMFELIQQNCDSPSVYKDVERDSGFGFHHWAVSCKPDTYDQRMQNYVEAGAELALEGAVDVGARAAYVDTRKELGGMIELIEMTDDVEALFTMIHSASHNWDGTDPIRLME